MSRKKRKRSRQAVATRDVLSEEAIVAVALELLDQDGLEQFSMRLLAQRLGVTTMATYYLFPSKDDLLAAVHQAAFFERPPPEEGGPWLKEALALALWVRDGYVAHPVVVPLARLVPWSTPASIRMTERWLRVLRRGGFDGVGLARAFVAINSALTGLAQQEATRMTRPLPKDVEKDVEQAPLLRSALPDIEAIDRRKTFEVSVRILLRGLKRLDSKK